MEARKANAGTINEENTKVFFDKILANIPESVYKYQNSLFKVIVIGKAVLKQEYKKQISTK